VKSGNVLSATDGKGNEEPERRIHPAGYGRKKLLPAEAGVPDRNQRIIK
jgi:hypothetical protein